MIDFQNANEIFDVHAVYPKEDGSTHGYMLGRFYVEDGQLRILEDNSGILGRSLNNGPVSHSLDGLRGLTESPYLRVVAESEVVEGHHIDMVPQGTPSEIQVGEPPANVEAPSPGLGEPPQSYAQEGEAGFTMQTPPPVFDYIRVGMKEPQMVEMRGKDVYMNGHKLTQDEVDRLLYTIHAGLAKLRYRKGVA